MGDARLGFLGAGRMGEALVRGILGVRLARPEHVLMSDIDGERLARLARELGVRVVGDNAELVAASDAVFVALKPGVVREVLPGLAGAVGGGKLVVSIAAGVTLGELEGMLGAGARVVRVMPNAACVVGAGASGYALGPAASEADGELVHRVLSAVGMALRVPEAQLDAVTGLSGSGPAFAALVIEGLADGGVLCGLPREAALKLAAQTVLGAARLVLETGQHPAELKDMVASPGGTTMAGLKVLEAQGLRAALIQAVEAAARRAKELGRKPGARRPEDG